MVEKYKIPLEEVIVGIERFVLNGNRRKVVIKGDSDEKSLLIKELEAKGIPHVSSRKLSENDYGIDLTKIELTY